ncbi:primase [Pseudanabaena phage Pan2]|nr:primase [Pseudanabaena phage Pan2]
MGIISNISQREFLTTIFSGIDTGLISLVRASTDTEGRSQLNKPLWFNAFVEFSDFLAAAEKYSGEDLYFATSSYGQEYRRKDDPVARTRVVYADVDGQNPDDFRLPPSILVESSPGHYHAYWLLNEPVDTATASDLSTRIAKAHSLDASSGIQTKLLRVPGSLNTKYGSNHMVVARRNNQYGYTPEQIAAAYEPVATADYDSVELSTPAAWPDYFDVLDKIPADDRIQFLMEWDKRTADDPDKRSERRFELIRLLMEKSDLTPEEIAVVVWRAPVSDHFREQNRGIDDLYRFDVAKALGKQVDVAELERYEPEVTPADVVHFISSDEMMAVYEVPGFMDRWRQINYESLHSKTPDQYIRINGYTYLAGCLGNRVTVMPPGTNRAVFCNLYAINEGPTTSGKSEALFFLKRYLKAFSQKVGYELVVGSNATAEGLIKALKTYDKRTAMLITEEVSGKFRQWAQSSNMAHMREAELEIYDNYLPKNLRAGEGAGSVENVHLSFTQYMMGVDAEIEALLDRGFLRSGYIPRCLVVKAERMPFDETELLSIEQGDPDRTQDVDEEPARWAESLSQSIMRNQRFERTKTNYVVMQFADDAWARFLEFRAGLLKFAEAHDDPDVVRPMAIRFAISCQKMMALLAYERVAGEVQMIDVLRVLADAEDFWRWSMELVQGVSDSAFARLQDEVLTWLVSRGRKCRMVDYHSRFSSLGMKERSEVLESLTSRGLVRQVTGDRGGKFLEMAE